MAAEAMTTAYLAVMAAYGSSCYYAAVVVSVETETAVEMITEIAAFGSSYFFAAVAEEMAFSNLQK